MTKHKDAGNALRVQQHQQRATQRKLGEVEAGTKQLKQDALSNMDELDALMSEFEEINVADSDDSNGTNSIPSPPSAEEIRMGTLRYIDHSDACWSF